jgi:hypothetical protein
MCLCSSHRIGSSQWMIWHELHPKFAVVISGVRRTRLGTHAYPSDMCVPKCVPVENASPFGYAPFFILLPNAAQLSWTAAWAVKLFPTWSLHGLHPRLCEWDCAVVNRLSLSVLWCVQESRVKDDVMECQRMRDSECTMCLYFLLERFKISTGFPVQA